MTHYKTMVVFQGESNLAEDRFINTFHFEKVGQIGTQQQDVDDIHAALTAFYTAAHAPSGITIASRMPLQTLTDSIQFRTYNMADGEPRQPIIDSTAAVFGGGAPLPTEVSLVASFHGNRSIPRERGRIYIGPLTMTAGETGPAGKGMVPVATFVSTIATAMSGLKQDLDAIPDLRWCVFSPTRLSEGLGFSGLTAVTGGWCDNAFDIQRRRGTAATSRSVWGSAQPPPP